MLPWNGVDMNKFGYNHKGVCFTSHKSQKTWVMHSMHSNTLGSPHFEGIIKHKKWLLPSNFTKAMKLNISKK